MIKLIVRPLLHFLPHVRAPLSFAFFLACGRCRALPSYSRAVATELFLFCSPDGSAPSSPTHRPPGRGGVLAALPHHQQSPHHPAELFLFRSPDSSVPSNPAHRPPDRGAQPRRPAAPPTATSPPSPPTSSMSAARNPPTPRP
jgi:hypothetical protein